MTSFCNAPICSIAEEYVTTLAPNAQMFVCSIHELDVVAHEDLEAVNEVAKVS